MLTLMVETNQYAKQLRLYSTMVKYCCEKGKTNSVKCQSL